MKKIAAILTSILFIFSNIGINVMAAENDISEYPIISITNGKEIDNNEAETLINNMIELQNKHKWQEMAGCWLSSIETEYLELFEDENSFINNVGICTVNSAKVDTISKINEDEITDIMRTMLPEGYNSSYAIYFVGIDYEVNEVTEYFYNGINYRLAYVGYEDDELKILALTEVPIDILVNLAEGESLDVALLVSAARVDGYIIDSDMSIHGYLSDEVDKELEVYDKNVESLSESGNSVQNERLLRGVSMYASVVNCRSHYSVSTVKVKMTKSANISYYGTNGAVSIGMNTYIKNVIPKEIEISTYGVEAIKAQIICSKQYAVWYTKYQHKYSGLGYDLRDDSRDQNYVYNAYSNMDQVYRQKLDGCYSSVYRVHVHKSNGQMFCTHYANSPQSGWGFSYMVQTTAKKLGDANYSYQQILQNCFNNGVDDQGYSIGSIVFANYK